MIQQQEHRIVPHGEYSPQAYITHLESVVDSQQQTIQALEGERERLHTLLAMEFSDPNVVQQSQRRLRTLYNTLPDLLFCINRQGVLLDYKAGQESALLVSPTMFIGKHILDVLPADVARQTLYHMHMALETGHTQNYSYCLTLAEKRCIFEARCAACHEDEVLVLVRGVPV